jgi:hypothetical protein
VAAKPDGYTDTPMIPGSTFCVHDPNRPQPRVVTPPSASTQDAPGSVPSDATVLFDGTDLSGWVSVKEPGTPAGWKVENGYMEVLPGTGNIKTKDEFGSCHLHVEFATPEVVKGDGQGRGNSGVFLMEKYEFQVLDNYDNPTYPDGTVGSIYGQCAPLVNPSRKPAQWQVYDIYWTAPVFDGDLIKTPARATVILNGLPLHIEKVLQGPTKHKVTSFYEAHAPAGPLMLQDHGDLVRFRNIWYRPIGEYDKGA